MKRLGRATAATLIAGTVGGAALLAAQALVARNRRYAQPELGLALRASVGASGSPPLRLVLLGDSSALGVGVDRVSDTIGGQLAQLLAEGATTPGRAAGVSGPGAGNGITGPGAGRGSTGSPAGSGSPGPATGSGSTDPTAGRGRFGSAGGDPGGGGPGGRPGTGRPGGGGLGSGGLGSGGPGGRPRQVQLSSVGVSGSRSTDLATQVARALLGDRPDVAVILIGANDATGLRRPGEAAAYLGAAVRRLRDAGVEVVVGACPDLGAVRAIAPPLRQIVGWLGRQVARAQIRAVQEAGGAVVDLAAETGPVFRADAGTLCYDGYHPSADGYRLWAHALLPAVASAAARSATRR